MFNFRIFISYSIENISKNIKNIYSVIYIERDECIHLYKCIIRRWSMIARYDLVEVFLRTQ